MATSTGREPTADPCAEILARGSVSFNAAARLFPARLRAPVASLYAFCRTGDDAVDLAADPRAGLDSMLARLDRIFQRQPGEDPVDRAFAQVVDQARIPRAIPAALLEGFAWDAQGRRYRDLPELETYCARVASTVGVMMTLLFGPRRPEVLARACDLGLAMQLTNICRDVGEDARAGRLYLPLDWCRQAGIDPEAFIAHPSFTPGLGELVERLLAVADGYYRRADRGISLLPRACRLPVRSARLIYAEIGQAVRRNHLDSVSRRAYTGKTRKAWLLMRALPSLLWPARPSPEPARPGVQFLIDAVEAS